MEAHNLYTIYNLKGQVIGEFEAEVNDSWFLINSAVESIAGYHGLTVKEVKATIEYMDTMVV
jgi:hypothetical protein